MSTTHPDTLRRVPRFIAFLSRLLQVVVRAVSRCIRTPRGPREPYLSDRMACDIGMHDADLAKRRIKWPSQQNRW